MSTAAIAARAERSDRLRGWNLGAGFLHLAQGLVMLAIASGVTLPVMSNFLQDQPGPGVRLFPEPQVLFDLPIALLVVGFLFLSALAHLLIATVGYGWYRRNLALGMNPGRWMEYALSSSLMIVVISMLVGIYDVVALLAIAAVNACMILFGWMMEVHNRTTTKTNWLSYWFGVFAGAVPWVAIAIYLIGAGRGDVGPPTFVYFIFVSIFLFFNVFAVNMVLQYRKVGQWRDYLYGERVYILLSLVAKSLLAWQVYGGTLRPN